MQYKPTPKGRALKWRTEHLYHALQHLGVRTIVPLMVDQTKKKPILHPTSTTHLVLELDLLASDAANDNLGGVLGDDLVVVQHLKLLGCVTAHV